MSPTMSVAYGPKTFRDAVGGVRMAKPRTNGFGAFITVNYKAARASTRPRASTAHLCQAVAAPSLWLPDTDNAGRLPAPIRSTKHRNVMVNVKAGPLKAAGRTNTARQQSPQPSIVKLADFVQHAARRSASSRSSSDRSVPRQASASSGGASPSPAAAAAVPPTLVKAASWAAAARAPPAVSASTQRSKKAAPKTSKTMPSNAKGVKTFRLCSATEFPSLRS